MTSAAAFALALSLLVMPGPKARRRVRLPDSGPSALPPRTRARESNVDSLGLAANWDLLAACLRAGLPVPAAVHSVASGMSGATSIALRRAAELVALGAAPDEAWRPALECPSTAALARAARRTAQSGTALADAVNELAVSVRDRAADEAEARAERAGVLVTAPLGLCFLPAFVCLGVVPVVIGLASGIHIFT